MRVGGKVLCIKSFDFDFPCPKEGKVYTVSDLSDQCGCGRRIRLKELPQGSLKIDGRPCHCGFCGVTFMVTLPGGWNKVRFIDLEGEQELDIGRELADVLLTSFTIDKIRNVNWPRKKHARL